MDKQKSMLLKGFRFGLLLQIAVGPVCFFIFQTSVNSGFWAAESGVLGVALADAIYIFAAFLGVGALIEKRPALRRALKYTGAAVLVLFGLNLVAGIFSAGFLPVFSPGNTGGTVFLHAFVITLSSPLTIVFWAGVFTQKLADEDLRRSEMAVYGFGAVLSTLAFLTAAAGLGGLTNSFFSEDVIRVLNVIVGLLLIGFGIRTAFKK